MQSAQPFAEAKRIQPQHLAELSLFQAPGSEFRVPFQSRNQKSGSLKKLARVPLYQNGYNGLTRRSI
jgi:hypothetical protein